MKTEIQVSQYAESEASRLARLILENDSDDGGNYSGDYREGIGRLVVATAALAQAEGKKSERYDALMRELFIDAAGIALAYATAANDNRTKNT